MNLTPDGFDAGPNLVPQEFHASWRSGLGFAVVFVGVVAAALMAVALARHGSLVDAAMGAAGLLLGWLAWALAGKVRGNGPFLRFGPEGISGRAVKQGTLAWRQVADVRVESVQGNTVLVIHRLVEPGERVKKSFLGVPAGTTRIGLGALHAKLHPQVIEAAYAQFSAHAGARAIEAARAQAAEARDHLAFDARLAARTPRVWAMPLVMGLCVAVWVANVATGMGAMQPRSDDLFRWGANATSAVQAGQWWRLLTAMFLHGGLLHLALNMYALWGAGQMVTRLFGNRGFLVVYLGAGLAGNALSLHFSGQTGVSVGASGAVFGVVGALLAAVLQHGGKFPMGRSKQMLTSLGIFVFYSLAYGFSQSGIDNAAHIGGLVAGFAAGWLLVEKIDDEATPARRLAGLAGAAAVCAGATVALALFAAPAQRDMATYFSDIERWNALQTEMSTALQALRDDGTKLQAGQLDEAGMLGRLETVHAVAMRRIEAGYAALRLPPTELVGRYVQAQRRYAGAMAALMDADVQRQKAPTPELAEKVRRLSAEARQANEAIGALNEEAKDKGRQR